MSDSDKVDIYHLRRATKRLNKEISVIAKDPIPGIDLRANEDNILEWHYVLHGKEDTPYQGGLYHGKLIFPPDFPFAPPKIIFLTPNGRFKTNERICFSLSDFHPEEWKPGYSVTAVLQGVRDFMHDSTDTIGSIETSESEKRQLAENSATYNASVDIFCRLFPKLCGKAGDSENSSSESSQKNTESDGRKSPPTEPLLPRKSPTPEDNVPKQPEEISTSGEVGLPPPEIISESLPRAITRPPEEVPPVTSETRLPPIGIIHIQEDITHPSQELTLAPEKVHSVPEEFPKASKKLSPEPKAISSDPWLTPSEPEITSSGPWITPSEPTSEITTPKSEIISPSEPEVLSPEPKPEIAPPVDRESKISPIQSIHSREDTKRTSIEINSASGRTIYPPVHTRAILRPTSVPGRIKTPQTKEPKNIPIRRVYHLPLSTHPIHPTTIPDPQRQEIRVVKSPSKHVKWNLPDSPRKDEREILQETGFPRIESPSLQGTNSSIQEISTPDEERDIESSRREITPAFESGGSGITQIETGGLLLHKFRPKYKLKNINCVFGVLLIFLILLLGLLLLALLFTISKINFNAL